MILLSPPVVSKEITFITLNTVSSRPQALKYQNLKRYQAQFYAEIVAKALRRNRSRFSEKLTGGKNSFFIQGQFYAEIVAKVLRRNRSRHLKI
jgi:hypothetical protein